MLYRQFYFEHIADSIAIYPGVLEGSTHFAIAGYAVGRHQQNGRPTARRCSNTLI